MTRRYLLDSGPAFDYLFKRTGVDDRVAVRLRYAFVKTYKPVLDDTTYRSFDSMEAYRRWCETELPSWLGYGRI